MDKKEASEIVTKELREEWIKKNVYPKHESSVAEQIYKDYVYFNSMIATE